MAYKSSYQSYLSDWTKTVNWAVANKIPESSIGAVYALDAKRLAQGDSIMSQAERMRALLSASNLQSNQVLPTDLSKPYDLPQNIWHDASNIFTGLTGLFTGHTEHNLFDQFYNAIRDPNGKNLMALASQWIPGVADISELEHGGISNLLTHPLISALDVLPLGDAALRGVARAGYADSIAERAGLTTDQLMTAPGRGGKGTLLRVSAKMVGHLRAPGAARDIGGGLLGPGSIRMMKDPITGAAQMAPATISSRVLELLSRAKLGPEQGRTYRALAEVNAKMTALHREIATPFYAAMGHLQPDQVAEMNRLLTTSGLTPEMIRDSNNVDVAIKEAIDAYLPVRDFLQEQLLATGQFEYVTMPNGTQEMYRIDSPVSKAARNVEMADERAAKVSERSDDLVSQIDRLDSAANPFIDVLDRLAPAIYRVLKGTDPFREQFEPQQVADLLRIPVSQVTETQLRSLDDIFSPGNLVDQMKSAYRRSDWKMFNGTLRKILDRFKTNALNPLRSPELAQMSDALRNLYEYGKARGKLERQLATEINNRVLKSIQAAVKAHRDFDESIIYEPPARYRPMYQQIFSRKLREYIVAAKKVDEVKQSLVAGGKSSSEAEAIMHNPRVLAQTIAVMSKSSSQDPFMGVLSRADIIPVERSAYEELARMRGIGMEPGISLDEKARFNPTYVPTLSGFEHTEEGTYNVTFDPTRLPTVDASKARLFEWTNSVYDVKLAVNKAMLQQLARDGLLEFMDTYMPKFTYSGESLRRMADSQGWLANIDPNKLTQEAALTDIYRDRFGMLLFNPEQLFGLRLPGLAPGAQYIPKDIADALSSFVSKGQLPIHGLVQTGTELFRTSVLAFSPRFTAHIVFGGSFLVALRSSPYVFKYIGDAYKIARQISKGEVRPTDPLYDLVHRPAQYGRESDLVAQIDKGVQYHGGVQKAQWLLHFIMDKEQWDKSSFASWAKAATQLNYRFTNFAVNMQRALSYLDGADKITRQGTKLGYILDEEGHQVELTPERAHYEGIKAANRVMGDLREMTPFERQIMTTLMPFYGWTKHVIRYVSSYPLDHPYRAMFLSNVSNLDSEQVPSDLPLRIQLLMGVGQPSESGEWNVIDVRALNPLRDTANYMTLSGFLSTLNPFFTGSMAAITQNPEFIYGGVPLYPTLSYNDIYGVEQGSGGMSTGQRLASFAEQFVPQISALDVAMNLSGQYRNLRQTNPNEYAKLIMQSFGIPFTPETVNLKQIAAKNEITRYHVAAALAQQAWQTGDFSQLAGIPLVPNPLQPDYQISPDQLHALWNFYKGQAPPNVSPEEIAPSLPAPSV